MPNYIPLLLLGGGAAYLMTQGKGKGAKQKQFLTVSDDCTDVKILGFTQEELKKKVDDKKFVEKYKGSVEKWSIETLDLQGWFEDRPGITATDLDDLALEIAKWRYPQCNITEDALGQIDSIKFGIFVAVYAAVVVYAVKNRIVSMSDIMNSLGSGTIAGFGPIFPEGTTGATRLPPQLQMVL